MTNINQPKTRKLSSNSINSFLIGGFLITLGSIQLLGDLLDWKTLKAIGAASHASPAPKVFTTQNGFETFSSEFEIYWIDSLGEKQTLKLTPEIYKRIKGPYNRRNAYGAAISYGPVLYDSEYTRPMFYSVVDFAFCKDRKLLKELLLDSTLKNDPTQIDVINNLEIKITPRIQHNKNWKLNYPIQCEKANLIGSKIEAVDAQYNPNSKPNTRLIGAVS